MLGGTDAPRRMCTYSCFLRSGSHARLLLVLPVNYKRTLLYRYSDNSSLIAAEGMVTLYNTRFRCSPSQGGGSHLAAHGIPATIAAIEAYNGMCA
jgi:hypothetical protein